MHGGLSIAVVNQMAGIVTGAVGALGIAGLLWAWLKRKAIRHWFRSGQLAISQDALVEAQKLMDAAQQTTIGNLKVSLDALTARLQVLDTTIHEKDAAHAAEIVQMRGQFAAEFAKKDKTISEAEARITELEAKATQLEGELRQARDDLAYYAQQRARHPNERSGDAHKVIAPPPSSTQP